VWSALGGGVAAVGLEPAGQFGAIGGEGRVERVLVVPPGPVAVGPGGAEQDSDVLVPAAACCPECRGDPFGFGAWSGGQFCPHAVGEAQGRGLIDAGAGATLD
jgi:hypothetical protein